MARKKKSPSSTSGKQVSKVSTPAIETMTQQQSSQGSMELSLHADVLTENLGNGLFDVDIASAGMEGLALRKPNPGSQDGSAFGRQQSLQEPVLPGVTLDPVLPPELRVISRNRPEMETQSCPSGVSGSV